MIKFILKGLFRDKSRSLFPLITVTIGVIISVFMHSYLRGFMEEFIDTNSKFQTGHVKVVTQAYAELIEQRPNDLALIGTNALLKEFNKEYPEITWAERIYFGGLMDVPNEFGETREQTFFSGMAIDLLSTESIEHELMKPNESIVKGREILTDNEILISDEMALNLNINPGDLVTLISDTMEGNMTFGNFTVAGTVRFGIMNMDRGALITDISAARNLLDMVNATGELLGYFPEFDAGKTDLLVTDFNNKFTDYNDEFSPTMLSLLDQENLRGLYAYTKYASSLFISGFIFIMSIILWNAGLMNSIRRYGEIGVRLAIGEGKLNIYLAMIYEVSLIGIGGVVLGTALGLIPSYLMQNIGIDVSDSMSGTSMIMSTVIRGKVTVGSYFIGFIPGLLATVFGAALAGIGIFNRNTAQLFKELEF